MILPCVAGVVVAAAALLPQDVEEWIRQLSVDDAKSRNQAGEALIRHWESDRVL